jgi:hypothetical protein
MRARGQSRPRTRKERHSCFGKEAKVAEGTILALALLAAILIIDRLTK